MKNILMSLFGFSFALVPMTTYSSPKPIEKEWTFLVFLNGNNSLDFFGSEDINEMEQVGSSAHINVVVQWASMARNDVLRMKIERDSLPQQVSSPVIHNAGNVDMGDYRSLVDFVRWAKEKYPAKRYFIDVWNHGSGWHLKQKNLRGFHVKPQDISFDDKTGNVITTEQLGTAMREIQSLIGKKVSIYGSDACLMAMIEVASEMKDSVQYSVGSEEIEPGEGWHYGDFLRTWNELGPTASTEDVAKALTRTYKTSYQNGSQGTQEVQLSAFNLEKTDELNLSIKTLSQELKTLARQSQAQVKLGIESSLSFLLSDYVDLYDFSLQLERQSLGVKLETLEKIRLNISHFVVSNEKTSYYSRAGGVSIWIPTVAYTYDEHKERYKNLDFSRVTLWKQFLEEFFKRK